MLETAIEHKDYWPRRYMYGVETAYEHIGHQWGYSGSTPMPVEFTVPLHMGIKELCRITRAGLETLEWERKRALFARELQGYQDDLVHSVASIAFESLVSVAMVFKGPEHQAWHHVIGVFMEVYPRHESEVEGMDPLQQQLAVQLLKKLIENVEEGWYPALSRVLLAALGPFGGQPQFTKRTAHVILRDGVYKELQKLAALHAKDQNKIGDFLPTNVKYDATANTLTHIFWGGSTQITNLGELNIPDIDLTDSRNWIAS